MTAPWHAKLAEEPRRGRCNFYIGRADVGIETFRLCSRTGTRIVRTEGRQVTEGPWCWQHARVVQDRTVAEVMTTRRVTTEEVS